MEKNTFENIEAVIFDLDGTLADSMWVWSRIDEQFFKEKNMDFPPGLNRDIEGLGFTDTAIYFVNTFHLKESVEEVKEGWNKMAMELYKNKVALKEGAMPLIKRLKEGGKKIGIATSNSKELLDAFLLSKGLNGYIDAAVTCCDVKKSKPEPDVFLEAAKKLGICPRKCLVFEDIPAGIKAGKSAGMTVCAVYDDYSKDLDEEKKALSDLYITDFTEACLFYTDLI